MTPVINRYACNLFVTRMTCGKIKMMYLRATASLLFHLDHMHVTLVNLYTVAAELKDVILPSKNHACMSFIMYIIVLMVRIVLYRHVQKLLTSLLPVVSTIVKFCLLRKKTLGKLVLMMLASTPVGESTINSNKKNSSGSNAKLSVSKAIGVVSILLPLLINITVELTM